MVSPGALHLACSILARVLNDAIPPHPAIEVYQLGEARLTLQSNSIGDAAEHPERRKLTN